MRKPALKIVSPAVDPADEPDGRRRRSHDSRARIVAAMLALTQEGEIAPGAEQVAARAGVGLRTVFRHFDDMESLYSEMSATIEAELAAIVLRPFTGATWRARLSELIERRSFAFEKIAPFKNAADVHRHDSAFLAAAHKRLVATLRDILRSVLPAEIAADALKFEALDMMMSFEAWRRLRADQGLSVRRAREVLEGAVMRVAAGR
ncbi:MAG TPA: TetR/AcrR family transcriptional regulator [Caulobacterales bacterium]|nr:TetR/AcrR family transcriptional regulator [Caulobacterales bacterium]